MRYINQKVLGIAMALLLLALASCTSKPEGEISQTDRQKQESSMAAQEQEEQESSTTVQSQEEEEGGTMVQSPEQPSAAPQEAAQVQEKSGDNNVITITGRVESGQDGMIISADDGPYVVTGQDLSEMAGMMVQATGALKESEGLRTIEVTDVKIVK